MSVGKQLLFSILAEEDASDRRKGLSRLMEHGITGESFQDDREAASFEFMRSYFLRYGTIPSIQLVEIEADIRFPEYALDEPFDFWFDEFRKHLAAVQMVYLTEELEDLVQTGRIETAIDCVTEYNSKIRGILQNRRTVTTMGAEASAILEQHALTQTGQVQTGVRIGFPYIDAVTGGIQPGDFWVVVGESGTGKTFVSCRAAMGAVEQGKKALLVGMEMPNRQMVRRQMALVSRVNAMSLRLGRLSAFAVDQIRHFVEDWRTTGKDDRLVFIEGRINMTVDDLMLAIYEHRPDVVFVDGAYMLKMNGGFRARWEMSMEVMEALKQVAMTENIGLVGSFQFDQKAKTKGLSNIMGGQAIGQIASVVLGIENEDGTSDGFNDVDHKELTLFKGREGERGKIRLRYDMRHTSIEQVEVLMGYEALSERDRQTPDPEDDPADSSATGEAVEDDVELF